MIKHLENSFIYKFVFFFLILLAIKFTSLSAPFYGDELIYIIDDSKNITLWNFVPFSSQYTSHYGHPPLLVLLSFWIDEIGLPFTQTLRTLYLAFSALMLTGVWNLSRLFNKKQSYSFFTIILIAFNPLFFTQSSMTIGNILECAIILHSLVAFLNRDKLKLLILLSIGSLIRESMIGPILIFYLYEEDRLNALKRYLLPTVLLILFFFAEKKAHGIYFNHSIALQKMDHGTFYWSFRNVPYFFESLRALAHPTIWTGALLSLYYFFKINSIQKKRILIIFSICIPYVAFFGLYNDSQGRDFLILLPITLIWFSYLFEFKLVMKKIVFLLVGIIFTFQILQFNIVRDKDTPNLSVYFSSYQKILHYLNDHPDIKDNLVAHFPFNKIFTNSKFGHLDKMSPISEGNRSYLLTSTPMKLNLIHEVKIPTENKTSLFIYEN